MMLAIARLSCAVFAVLVPLATMTTAAADAEPFDPWLIATSSDTSPEYVLETADGSLVLGDGAVGQSVGTVTVVGATYASGSGAAGNVASDSDLYCLVYGC
jgi:hypothetical protein